MCKHISIYGKHKSIKRGKNKSKKQKKRNKILTALLTNLHNNFITHKFLNCNASNRLLNKMCACSIVVVVMWQKRTERHKGTTPSVYTMDLTLCHAGLRQQQTNERVKHALLCRHSHPHTLTHPRTRCSAINFVLYCICIGIWGRWSLNKWRKSLMYAIVKDPRAYAPQQLISVTAVRFCK